MRGIWVLGLVLVAASGCTGDGGPSSAALLSTAPPTLAKGEPAGSIAGRVISDETQPLAGVELGLVPAGREATSAPDGTFRFDEVPAGEHTIYATKLGYEQVAKRVQVLDGEESNLTLTLVPVPLADPRVEVQIAAGFFPCALGSVVFSTFDCTLNLTGTSRSAIRANFAAPGLTGVVYETVWQSSSTFSAQWLRQYHYVGNTQEDAVSGPSGMRLVEDGPFSGKKYESFESYLPVSAPTQPVALALEQKFEVYSSGIYKQALSEEYSAIPKVP